MVNVVTNCLKQMRIPFRLQEHPAVFTMAEAEEQRLMEGGLVPKNLFLKEKKGDRRFLVTVTDEGAVDMKGLRAILSARELTFCSEAELKEDLGLAKGSATPFGIVNDEEKRVEVVIDTKLRGEKPLGLHPNVNTATAWLSYDGLIRFLGYFDHTVHEVDVPLKNHI